MTVIAACWVQSAPDRTVVCATEPSGGIMALTQQLLEAIGHASVPLGPELNHSHLPRDRDLAWLALQELEPSCSVHSKRIGQRPLAQLQRRADASSSQPPQVRRGLMLQPGQLPGP